ncbi:hypothetical protein C8J55DRAFT_562114 [Lentinula edodes]|uniref:Uncharacterized protein n=1 Tax=Lentinula lateritia TaxID=40482 RepID=A0A9W9DLI4_9AGAR|nr:hypothetical protein C8J55DRAFT_562114 [Lentinula edodes]
MVHRTFKTVRIRKVLRGGLISTKIDSKTSSTRDSPQSVSQNESTSECTSLEVAALKQLPIHQDVLSSESFSALEKCANIPNPGAVDKEAESVDADTETAVATNMSESINSSLFTSPRRESISPLSPSSSHAIEGHCTAVHGIHSASGTNASKYLDEL